MQKIKLINIIKDVIFVVEMILAVLILLGVAAGLISTLVQIPDILSSQRNDFYTSFKIFLGNALLLIVGVELIRMLITHTTRATLELIVFVIARKLLIYTDSMVDIFLGTVALAIAFATIRFLLPKPATSSPSMPGRVPLKELQNRVGFEIPADEEMTLDKFIRRIRRTSGLPKAGEEIHAGPITLTIEEVNEDGTIGSASVKEANFVSHEEDKNPS
ncbi:hypothetical protein ABB02_00078 [Clostridiaceae bacterium JG1575]|nr:hypothetical protein ABB02_00078 [Clostridiaceae bacterium JG1575]